MDEVNAVKDILKDALSRIDQIPQASQAQASQSENPQAESSNNTSTSLLSRAQNNFR